MYWTVTVVIKAQQQVTVTDKVRNRLEQLDDFEEVIIFNNFNRHQFWAAELNWISDWSVHCASLLLHSISDITLLYRTNSV